MKWSVSYGETILNIDCTVDLRKEVLKELIKQHTDLLSYINKDPVFFTSYDPIEISSDAPEIIRLMHDASTKFNVGPMATVAGTISELIGKRIQKDCDEFTIENGGDIFLSSSSDKTIQIKTSNRKFADKLSLNVSGDETPIGICSSSSSIGHSISFGRTELVVSISDSSSIADAAATYYANQIKTQSDLTETFEKASKNHLIRGFLVLVGDELGVYGKIPEIMVL